MAQQNQQYELKIGVMHHPSLKTTQFIQFLQSQSNQFLNQALPQSLPQPLTEKFIANYQSLPRNASPQQYVGILVIYNAASVQSFQYAKDSLKKLKQINGQLFILVIQMQAGQKKVNAIGQDGYTLCKKQGFIFIKLSIENSQDLVTQINKSLYELIENYYYPNQEDKQIKQIRGQYDEDQQIQSKQKNQSPYSKINNNNYDAPNSASKQPQQYVLEYQTPNIIASKSQRANMQGLLQKASRLRQFRDRQMIKQQQTIDQSINSVQKVLNNINRHISDKMESGWFSKLKDNLYAPIQKNSTAFAKIKLTQQFIDDFSQQPKNNYVYKSKKSLLNSFQKNSQQSRLIYNTTPVSCRNIIQEPVMKIVLALEQDKVIQFELNQASSVEQLAKKALHLFGIRQTENNLKVMQNKINKKIQTFVKETQRGIRNLQRRRIADRRFLNPKKSTL